MNNTFKRLLRNLSEKANSILSAWKKSVTVEESSLPDQLGYATNESIYLTWDHEYYQGLKNSQKIMAVTGTFSHEIMHQLLSSFTMLQEKALRLPGATRHVYHCIANIIEDLFIDHYAPEYISSYLCRCRSFATNIIYKALKPIESTDSAWVQYVKAMIEFKFGGLLKSSFTNKDAEQTFYSLLPTVVAAYKERNAKRRFDYYDEVFDKTRHLWEEEVKAQSDFADFMSELLQGLIDDSQADGVASPPSGEESSSGKAERNRQKLLKYASGKLSGGDMLPMQTSSGGEGLFDDAPKASADEDVSDAEASDEAIAEEEDNAMKRREEREAEERRRDDEELSSLKSCLPQSDTATTIKRAEEGSAARYEHVMNTIGSVVSSFSNKLKKALLYQADENRFTSSGRFNIKRATSTRMTPNRFTKKREHSDKSDTAILLLIDESGSMSGRLQGPIQATIGLGEICERNKISYEVIGFTKGRNMTLRHFLNWRNTKQKRQSLTNISAYEGTPLGYSIAYANNILKRRPEAFKLLLAVTDGMPDNMVTARDAVKAARKDGVVVVGIAIGDAPLERLREIFGADYILVPDVKNLFPALLKIMEREIKKF